MVATQRRDNSRFVGQGHPVLLIGREQTLEKSGGGIEHRRALTANLDADMDLLEVNKVGLDTADV